MARKPNYGYEKRQKELARKAKKEEKKRLKSENNEDESADTEELQSEPQNPDKT